MLPGSEEVSDVTRYIETHKDITLEDKLPEFRSILSHLQSFQRIDGQTRMLEVGTGTGWFPLLCRKNGMSCKGLEISGQLVEYARDFGRKYGLEPDIEAGSIAEAELGTGAYDVIVAKDTFEHVKDWQRGIRKIQAALRPGGLFYFTSTNKFSIFPSGEYDFPFYGWLPDGWRYQLRISRQGADIMRLGIDFNQFTYGKLRRFFQEVGFSRVMDRIQARWARGAGDLGAWKRRALVCLRHRPLRDVVLVFSPYTCFTCIK